MILLLKNHWQHFPSPRDLLIFLICSFKLLLLMIHWLLSFRKLANWSSRLNAVFTTLTLRFQTTYSFFAFYRTAINQICIPLSLYIYNVNTWTSCIWTADRHECVYMIFEDQLLEQWRDLTRAGFEPWPLGDGEVLCQFSYQAKWSKIVQNVISLVTLPIIKAVEEINLEHLSKCQKHVKARKLINVEERNQLPWFDNSYERAFVASTRLFLRRPRADQAKTHFKSSRKIENSVANSSNLIHFFKWTEAHERDWNYRIY